MPENQRSPVVSLALIVSSLTMMVLGAACWLGLFHIGASDHLVGGILIAVGMLDALLGLLFMNR